MRTICNFFLLIYSYDYIILDLSNETQPGCRGVEFGNSDRKRLKTYGVKIQHKENYKHISNTGGTHHGK